MENSSYNINDIILSEEQQLFIEKAKEGNNILVDACIGSGKTTAIQCLCNELPSNLKILYLTYNRLLKFDAKDKIKKDNVVVTNYHGFAFTELKKCQVTTGVSDLIQRFIQIEPEVDAYDVLIIDEYQDIEEELSKLLNIIKAQNPNIQIIAVGDMQQKIYDKTRLNVTDFIHEFLGNYIKLEFTQCFRLSADFAAMLGRIWNKKIIGVNSHCNVQQLPLEDIVPFLSTQKTKDILCLGKRSSQLPIPTQLSRVLNQLEALYPETFNKKTVYASIFEQDNVNLKKIPPNAAIFTTYDSSKGLERKICVILDFTKAYWEERLLKPQQSYEILRNIFCVAISRGKNHIIFATGGEPLLTENCLKENIQNKKDFYFEGGISSMFDFKYKEDIEDCFHLLETKPLPSDNATLIDIPGNDALIDLSPCIGIYQEACFFKNYDIDKEIELALKNKKVEPSYLKGRYATLSLERKILFLTAFETQQHRYETQVDIPFVSLLAKKQLAERLATQFVPDETVQTQCTLNFYDESAENPIIHLEGYTDVIKDETVYELKFVSELRHEHFLQCACYIAALNLEKGILWNTRNNTMYEIRIPDKKAFLNAVVKAISKGQYLSAYCPAADKNCNPFAHMSQKDTDSLPAKNNDATIASKVHYAASLSGNRCQTLSQVSVPAIAVLDTETNWNDEVMSIGIVIANSENYEPIDMKHYVLEPEYKIQGMYSNSLHCEDSSLEQICSRADAIEDLHMLLNQYAVNSIFTFSPFDFRHLPELNHFSWYDIMQLAAYKQYNPSIKDEECYQTGRLKNGFGVEKTLQRLMGTETYHEQHNALADAKDELKILQLLGHPVSLYSLAALNIPRCNKDRQKKPKTKTLNNESRPVSVPAPTQREGVLPAPSSRKKSRTSYGQKSTSKNETFISEEEKEKLYTVTELIGILHLSRYHIYNLIGSGTLPAQMKGNKYLIRKADVDAYLQMLKKERKRMLLALLVGILVAIGFFIYVWAALN